MTTVAVAIFFISAAVLGLELVLVRALSIGHYHHFSYLVISTALLGFGAGGTFVAVGSKSLTRHYKKSLWWLALGFGLVVPVVFWVSQKVPFDELQLIWDRRQAVYLLAYYLLFSVPFFCAGGSIALAFAALADRAHRLYFYNMVGSGLGAAALVALMYGNAAEHLLLVVSSLGFLAAVVLSVRLSWRRAVISLACGLVWVMGFSTVKPLGLEVEISQHKALVFYEKLPDANNLAVRHSPLGRLDCVRAPSIRHFPGGFSVGRQVALPEQILIITDGDGISAVNHFEDFNDINCFDYMTSALAYHLVDEPDVCIIGAGGGSDVVQALSLGAVKVTAVEMNSQVVELMRNEFSEFASGLYNRQDVHAVIGEGRSFLQTTGRKFNLITISLLDSYSASAAGVGAFNESHLYTVEALAQAFSTLSSNGLLSITRMLKAPARDNVKMFATVAETLRRRGVTNPAEHIIMIRNLAAATIVVSPKPFSDYQAAKSRGFAKERSFDLVHLSGLERDEVNQFNVLEEGPIYYDSARQILSGDRERFFSDYAYNIRPATDDRPYFFDFFKWKSLLRMVRALGRRWLVFSEWGYLVLAATLLQAVCAGALFILLPLWAARPIKAVRSGKLATFTYFLLLGFAYMFLEMGFIQKLTLLIGHPVFGVAVTLVGFLVFSGCGSLASGRLSETSKVGVRLIPAAVCAIIVIGAAEIILMRVWFEWLVGFSRWWRIVLALAATAPAAFFMGIPFPTAIREVHRRSPPLVPWAWGINGFASVTGAVLGTFLAISVGFTALAVIALACYFLAAVVSGKYAQK